MRVPVSQAMLRLVCSAALLLAASTAGLAQQGAPGTLTPTDSIFRRARQLVANGNGAAGRALVDSMVAVTPQETPAYADALFWRASLAASSADAEDDFRRIVVEYPLSPHAGDALLGLSHIELARGDESAAMTHLDRFILENPTHAERARAGLQLIRLEFEHGDAQRGCIVLGRTLRSVSESDVELRNQITYYAPRCASVDTTRKTETGAAAGAADTTARDSVVAAKPTKGRYTLQVAAFSARADATRLAKRLEDIGLDARVVGSAKPFRVRVGRYTTRAAATAAARQLKAKKIDAIVTEAGADDK